MNKFVIYIYVCFTALFLASCHKDEPEEARTKRTVLIYAVASNNLSTYLVDDKAEMIKAAPDVEGLGKDVRVLLYSVASQSAKVATLSELRKDASGVWNFETITEYDRNTFSTDPKRMREIYSDLIDIAPAEKYGLIFWSHGTGWIPAFSDHTIPETSGVLKSYGIDRYEGKTDYCDLHELASAIPDRMFDYVWFDLCYMMGVEVAYQLRNKCDLVAGYPTEDWSPGMNYDTTLPILAAYDPDLAAAGKAFFDYYNDNNLAVTVTVMKTAGFERLAHAASDIYTSGKRPSSAYGLMNYSRLKSGLYDFGQFTKSYIEPSSGEGKDLLAEFDAALSEMTVYAACSTKNFNNTDGAFDPAQYSGFSCHFPDSGSVAEEEYYRSLDWPQTVNP